ncbi:MAG: chromosome segregation ATPase [Calothrix sp. C42_A2020_038]|nr:chromosome segregation ATPase [Calothrix sp. C42_A2020_038]
MTTERDIPESWSRTTGNKSDSMTQLSRQRQPSDKKASVPNTNSTSKSVNQQQLGKSKKVTQSSQSPEDTLPKEWKLPRWTKSWVLWTGLLAFVPGTIAFVSMAMLFKLPAAPNCPSIFWPLASASVRLHCAQLAASKDTVDDLLQAIDLVKHLPSNHPLRAEVDRFLEDWSRDILRLADTSFQAGKLDEAIAVANRIPDDMPAHKIVKDKIEQWRSIWSKGEEIYKLSEEGMRNARWHEAFMAAARLLRVENKFWQTTKYQQLNDLIVKTREDGDKLARAESLAKSGSIENLTKAIKLAESITSDSYIYQKAQEAIPVFGRQMLNIAQKRLDNRDADEAISIAQQIPINANLQAETEDFIAIAEAQRNAWVGTISGLEAAIAQAQQISPTRAVYQKAQELIARWQLEIQDIARLDRARTLAAQGTVNDLNAAIAEAQLVPVSNPRAREARKEINRWVAQVQTIEDRPFLDRAEQLALVQDTGSLQAAITEANQIRRGRALYPEARKRISEWTAIIQRAQDQPYLDRARELARSGDLLGAIQVANQIGGNRALSGEAQAVIDDWQGQINARQNWKRAREIALQGTPEALAQAIRLANRVPDSSLLRNDVNPAIDQWSQQILDIARTQSESDIRRAIQTARLIPRYTAAYGLAREQIRSWREYLNPEPQIEQPEQLPGTFTSVGQ